MAVGHFATEAVLLFSFGAKLILTGFFFIIIIILLTVFGFFFGYLFWHFYIRFFRYLRKQNALFLLTLSRYFAIHLVFAFRGNFCSKKGEKESDIKQK